MNSNTRTALAELNRAFYARFAGDFAATRQSWPPGFKLILPYLAATFNVLDVGCGNARLLRFLYGEGWRGHYVGVDSSAALLKIARADARGLAGPSAEFVQADLLDAGWPGQAALAAGHEDLSITALAVLHHIPGAEQRAAFLRAVAGLLPTGGTAVVSAWQFVTAPRLARLILPWSEAGIDEADVEPGDYLLAWGQGHAGRRYCSYIDEAELRLLAKQAGLETAKTFYADGLEGNLNLYAVLAKR